MGLFLIALVGSEKPKTSPAAWLTKQWESTLPTAPWGHPLARLLRLLTRTPSIRMPHVLCVSLCE